MKWLKKRHGAEIAAENFEEVLMDLERIKIHNNKTEAHLEIRETTNNDHGIYKLECTNASGTVSVMINVTILDAPEVPEGPLVVSEINADSCKLSWKQSSYNGGSPIQ